MEFLIIIALKLSNEPDKFLSTVQIGITLTGILTGICSGDTLADDSGHLLISTTKTTAGSSTVNAPSMTY